MYKLFVALIVLTPFIGVSQQKITGLDTTGLSWEPHYLPDTTRFIQTYETYTIYKPLKNKTDTLSAYLLVTTRHMGIAYQKRGFIVNQYGKDVIYLDCDKKVIKPPFNVWQFRIIK